MADGLYAAIAQGGQPIQIENPVNQMAKIMAIKNAQQEQQLNALKFQEAQRGAAEDEELRNFLSRVPDLNAPEVRTNLLKYGTKGLAASKALSEQATAELNRQKTQAELIKSRLEQSREMLSGVSTPEQYMQWHLANHADPILGPMLTSRGITAESSAARINTALQQPGGLQALINESKLGVEKFMQLNAPKLTTQDIGGNIRILSTPGLGGAATVVPGSAAAKTVSPDTAARLAQEANIPLQQSIAEAKEYGQTLGQSRAKAEAALPGAIATAQQTVELIDTMIGKPTIRDKSGKVIQQGTRPMAGFQDYVGATWKPGARFVEGSDAADFQSYQKQIEGKAFLEAFESLRGAGAITEIEGTKGTQAILRMNKAQSEKEYLKAARELQDIVTKGVERAKAKAGGAAAPAATPNAAPATATQAPIYARNPSTGQRIMSTDGGVTWNPAR